MSNKKTYVSLREDPIIKSFLERIPASFDSNYTDNQLEGLKIALTERYKRKHLINFKISLGLVKWRYYFIIIAGKDLRSFGSSNKVLIKATKKLVLTTTISVITLVILFLIYLIKSALGIDFFPGFSLGLWQWFKGGFL